MEIEQIVARRVQERRRATVVDGKELSQAALGVRMGDYLGKPWSRQAVSAAEKGQRAFTAAELVALSQALSTTVVDLLTPPTGVGHITMPSGVRVEVGAASRLLSSDRMPTSLQHEVLGQLDGLNEALQQVRTIKQAAENAIPLIESGWDTTSRVLDHLVGHSADGYTAGPPAGEGQR